MTVREIAREGVVVIEPDVPVSEAVDLMREENVGSLIVEEDGTPVGIVTDRDLVMEVLDAGLDPGETSVRDVMSEGLFTVDPDIGLLDLIGEMGDEGVRRAPVVDDGELLGIVTLDDLIVLLSMELQGIANIIRAESPPYEVSATDLFG
jgi:CBS domain-containing protein